MLLRISLLRHNGEHQVRVDAVSVADGMVFAHSCGDIAVYTFEYAP